MRHDLLSYAAPALVVLAVGLPAYSVERDAPATGTNPDVASDAKMGEKSDAKMGTKSVVKLGAKSVTVFPVVLTSDQPLPPGMSKKVAELVGLLLERAGMKEIEIGDVSFAPPAKADLATIAEAFGKFVGSQNVRTEYALCGQFIGSPASGATEVRLVVTERQGKVVLAERMGPEQLAARGGEKVDPMTASVLLVDRLRGPWALADPQREGAPEGKMSQLWDKNSGLPPKSEREAMQRRLAEMKGQIKASTVAVFPVHLGGNSDHKAATALAAMLTKEGLGRVEAVTTDPGIRVEGNTNELRILWDTARALQDFLRKNPPASDYVLFADYAASRLAEDKLEVHAVHFIVCDRHGDWVFVNLANSRHADFQHINPQSVDDSNRLVVERLKSELR
jgi:hypothetical protein